MAMLEIDRIALSVRGFVEYVYSSGSIDSGFRTTTTLTEGTKAHQKIQKKTYIAFEKSGHFKIQA